MKVCPFGTQQFVQGIKVFDDGMHFALSSGWYKASRVSIFKFDFQTCSFFETFKQFVDEKYFVEGLTIVKDKIYQLTWREGRIHIWKIKGSYRNKLEHEITRTMPRFNKIKQGWGLAKQQQPDGSTNFWVSDNTTTLKTFGQKSWKHLREL